MWFSIITEFIISPIMFPNQVVKLHSFYSMMVCCGFAERAGNWLEEVTDLLDIMFNLEDLHMLLIPCSWASGLMPQLDETLECLMEGVRVCCVWKQHK